MNKNFTTQYKATIGADFLTKEIEVGRNTVTLQVGLLFPVIDVTDNLLRFGTRQVKKDSRWEQLNVFFVVSSF